MSTRLTLAVIIIAAAFEAGQPTQLSPAPLRAVPGDAQKLDPGRLLSIRIDPDAPLDQQYDLLSNLSRIIQLETRERVAGQPRPSSETVCGAKFLAWDRVFEELNTNIDANTVRLPPCPKTAVGPKVFVSKGTSLADQATIHMFSMSEANLRTIAAQNFVAYNDLTSSSRDAWWALPQSVITFNAVLRDDVGGSAAASVLNRFRDVASVSVGRVMDLVASVASDSESMGCQTFVERGDWPFDARAVEGVLLSNSTLRGLKPVQRAVVGVVDTGLVQHDRKLTPYLTMSASEKPEENGVDEDRNGYTDDIFGANMTGGLAGFPASNPLFTDYWHGTHVAGIAVGVHAPVLERWIKPTVGLRILNTVYCPTRNVNGVPQTSCAIPESGLGNALRYAGVLPGIPILNISLETTVLDAGLQRAMTTGPSLSVVAAGNRGINLDAQKFYPAAYGSNAEAPIITVAALDTNGNLASRSNRGRATVDLAAPGCHITSQMPDGTLARHSGTSQAAPLVAMTAALLYSEGMPVPTIRERILATTDPMPSLTTTVRSGGALNIQQALSVYEDLLVLKNGTVRRGRLSGTLLVEGTPRDWQTIRRVRFSDDAASVWLAGSADMDLPISTPNAIRLVVRSADGQTREESISVNTVARILPAVF